MSILNKTPASSSQNMISNCETASQREVICFYPVQKSSDGIQGLFILLCRWKRPALQKPALLTNLSRVPCYHIWMEVIGSQCGWSTNVPELRFGWHYWAHADALGYAGPVVRRSLLFCSPSRDGPEKTEAGIGRLWSDSGFATGNRGWVSHTAMSLSFPIQNSGMTGIPFLSLS